MNFLEVQWLGLCVSTAGSPGLIPDQGTKIPQVTQCGQKKLRSNTRSSSLSPVLSSRSFIILCFIFMSMIHFEFIFMKGVRSVCLYSLFKMWMYSYSISICWKYYPLLLCQRRVDYFCETISELSILFHGPICLLFCQ